MREQRKKVCVGDREKEGIREKMAVPEDDSKIGKAYNVLVRLALPPYTIHFKSPTFMKEAMREMLDKKVCKESLKATAQKAEVRFVSSAHVSRPILEERRTDLLRKGNH